MFCIVVDMVMELVHVVRDLLLDEGRGVSRRQRVVLEVVDVGLELGDLGIHVAREFVAFVEEHAHSQHVPKLQRVCLAELVELLVHLYLRSELVLR